MYFQLAAVKGISQVVLCRIIMCAPGMSKLKYYSIIQ